MRDMAHLDGLVIGLRRGLGGVEKGAGGDLIVTRDLIIARCVLAADGSRQWSALCVR